MSKKFRINTVTETEFTVQGHGVHTAYKELTKALKTHADAAVSVNGRISSRFDVTHIHTIGPFSLAYLLFGKGKKIVSAHVVPYSFVGSVAGAHLWQSVAEAYMRFFYSKADRLFAVSDKTADRLRDLGLTQKIDVVYNTIDASFFEASKSERTKIKIKLGLAGKEVVVGCGQIQPLKKFDVFCEVARKMPERKFIWVGGMPFKKFGASYDSMQKLIYKKPKNVKVTGVVSRNKVREYMLAADVMFIPSIKETFGLALVEGAAAGLPIVARDIEDYDATFGNNIVRGKDDTFAGLIEKLFSNKIFRENYQKRSKNIAAKFDSKQIANRVLEIYKSL